MIAVIHQVIVTNLTVRGDGPHRRHVTEYWTTMPDGKIREKLGERDPLIDGKCGDWSDDEWAEAIKFITQRRNRRTRKAKT